MSEQELTKQEIRHLWARAYRDPVFFCRTFLRHWFPTPMPWLHRGALAILTRRVDFLTEYGELDKICSHFVYKVNPVDPTSEERPIFTLRHDGTLKMVTTQHVLKKWPRGFSKTTLLNGAILYFIGYQECEFLAYLSETARHASTQLTNVKKELETNDKYRLVFGDLVPPRQDTAKWTEDQIEPTNGSIIIARGCGGQVRGSNVGAKRPKIIIIDDVEDEKSVKSAEQREATRKWCYEAVLPALDRISGEGRVFVAGTLLHRDALMQHLEKDPKWISMTFGAIDRDGDMLWPEMMSKKQLEEEKRSFALVANLAGYYREYFNQIRSEEGSKFKQSYLRYEFKFPTEFIAKALAIDPAISEKLDADMTAFGVAGMTRQGQFVALEAEGKVGMDPRAQIDRYFDLFGIHRPQRCGVEAIAYQRALIHIMQEEMFRKNLYFEIIPITHGKVAKIERVEGALQPRYAAGYVIHARPFPEYESQLLDWPNGRLDIPDVMSMCLTLLDPYAAAAAGDSNWNDAAKDLPALALVEGGSP